MSRTCFAGTFILVQTVLVHAYAQRFEAEDYFGEARTCSGTSARTSLRTTFFSLVHAFGEIFFSEFRSRTCSRPTFSSLVHAPLAIRELGLVQTRFKRKRNHSGPERFRFLKRVWIQSGFARPVWHHTGFGFPFTPCALRAAESGEIIVFRATETCLALL